MSEPFLAPVPIETGLAPATALPELSSMMLAKLAREIAMNIQELPIILERFKLTPAQYEAIKRNQTFASILHGAVIEWESAATTHERIKVQAAAALEEGMPTLGARMMKETEGLAAAVETGKLFAKIAGIGEERGGGTPGEKFTINIDLGADQKLSITKDVTPKASDIIEGQINEKT